MILGQTLPFGEPWAFNCVALDRVGLCESVPAPATPSPAATPIRAFRAAGSSEQRSATAQPGEAQEVSRDSRTCPLCGGYVLALFFVCFFDGNRSR